MGRHQQVMTAALAGLLLALTTVTARAQRDIIIHLKNGTPLEARYGGIQESRLVYSTAGSGSLQSKLAPEQLDWVEFPPPLPWQEAETAFKEQRFTEAAEAFEKIASATKNPAFFYPIPGNFVMLAKRRLIDCYRRLARPYDVHFHLREFDAAMLPADERDLSPSVPIWEAAGRKGWDDVLRLAVAKRDEFSPTSIEGCEIAYLCGLAHEKKGDPHKALLSFSKAYSLNGATDTVVSRVALIAAARLLEAEDPITTDEKEDVANALTAQVQVYSNIFGAGGLWDDASDRAASLNKVAIEITGARPEDDAAKAEAAKVEKEANSVDVAEAGHPPAEAAQPDSSEASGAITVTAKSRPSWQVTGPNILTNGSFESRGENGMPISWELEALAGEVQVALAPDAKDGPTSAMVRLAEDGTGGWSVAGLQLKKNADYRLSGWIRTAGIKDPRKGATIMLEDSDLQILGETKPLLGDNDWARVEVILNSGESSSFKLFCLLYSAGTAWFDQLELVPISKTGE
jgi:tetratricopeptide (TPR) repeat protein